jgi:hypothetical protein
MKLTIPGSASASPTISASQSVQFFEKTVAGYDGLQLKMN